MYTWLRVKPFGPVCVRGGPPTSFVTVAWLTPVSAHARVTLLRDLEIVWTFYCGQAVHGAGVV